MSDHFSYTIRPFGPFGHLISWDQPASQELKSLIFQLETSFRKYFKEKITSIIPSYNSIVINFTSPLSEGELTLFLNKQNASRKTVEPEIISIPVHYNNDDVNDLELMAKSLDLSPREIINHHTSKVYDVYSLGFLPGFAYMGFTPAEIEVKRKNNPRLKVPKGSVGLAKNQTGIYPSEAPGGWQIIGKTPINLFEPFSNQPILIDTSKRVQFVSINDAEFQSLSVDIANHRFDLKGFGK